MTINDAIAWLQRIAVKHGGDVDVFFDCPICNQAFTPTKIVTAAVHVTAKVKKGEG